ncbi:phosphoenolpyruvate synthase [Candidatus Woesebacteria bacterium]|nr:phosphoenolpyruvate synthase [Candidatus Woesebacteria bacterium]
MPTSALVISLKEIDKEDISIVGGKGANLGEMIKNGFPVPSGFAVTVESYRLFLKENDLSDKIEAIIKEVDINEPSQLESASKTVQKIILNSKIPESVSRDTIKAYKKLSGLFKQELVAVRSSATAEDLPGASFAGQQATFLYTKGETNLLLKVRECWASLFTPRAIFYRGEHKITTEKVGISVIVQKMVQSEVSGVMFSIDPVTNDKDRIVIEAVWGLGEMIVQGFVIPDKYVVQKDTFVILSKEISDQAVQLTRIDGETREVEVPHKIRDKQKITDAEIIKLAKVSDKLQNHYYFPQDTEWAKHGKELFIVQTRPVTTINAKSRAQNSKSDNNSSDQPPILTGLGASPGIGSGIVKILKSAREIEKVKSGDVLVASMTSPDFVPAMKKAVAIVTDQGGQTSHAAIVSRELGVPCVVGTKDATKILKETSLVTVNGKAGLVYLGGRLKNKEVDFPVEKITHKKTITHIYVNLGEPERAKEISEANIDGVGLLRAEFMIADIGIHPKEAIKLKKQDEFINKLKDDMEIFCKNFYPRPVVYRATDFKTNEYRALRGGKAWEPEEPNPLLGFRGAKRYVSDPEVFNLELQAIKAVRKKYNNLWLMIPFVRSPEELMRVRRIVASEELFDSVTFKFWMMAELPVNVVLLEEFINVGIDGVSIGSNDLTMLLEGVDRDNSEVASSFNEMSPVVFWALEKIIKTCNKHHITCSICGQAPSVYEDLVEKLVKWGITSISVNPDAINRVRTLVAECEERLIK